MNAGRKLLPGQPGTKRWVREYGDKLRCVRYRYDGEGKRRLTTIELVVENVPWEPKGKPPTPEIPTERIVEIRIAYGEADLGRKVRASGGQWNKQKKVWELPYREVLRLKLADRIIDS